MVLEISDALQSIGWTSPPCPGRTGSGAGAWTAPRPCGRWPRIPGVYVPSLYRPRYEADGTFAGLDRLDEAAPRRVTARIAADFETHVRGIRQIVPEHRDRLRPGPARGHARLHARLSLLPGRDAVPAAARARAGSGDRRRRGDPAGDRLRGDRADEPLRPPTTRTSTRSRRSSTGATRRSCLAAEHARRRLHRRAGRRHRTGRPAVRLHVRARGRQPAAARHDQQGRERRGDRSLRRAGLRAAAGAPSSSTS